MSYGQMSCAHSVEQVTCGSSCTWTLAPIQGSGEEGDEEQRRIRRVAPEQQVRWSAWTGRHQDTVAWSLVGRASGRVAGDGTDFGDRVDDGGRTRVLAFGRVGGVRAGGERPAARVWAVRGAAMQRTGGRAWGERLGCLVCMAQIARNLTVSLPFYINGDGDYCTTVQQLLQTIHVHSRLPL
jgi:hypothetical protein